jgi:hypothetical protein
MTEHIGDVAHVESRFSPFRDCVSAGARWVHGLRQTYHRLKIGARFAPNVPYVKQLFWTHPIVLLGDEAQAEARFDLFGDSTNLDSR